jgi:hypothetical protein
VCVAAKSKIIARIPHEIGCAWNEMAELCGIMTPPPSPCVGICRITPPERWCEGCKRTLEEIIDWPMLTPGEKRAVLAGLKSR